MSFPGSCTNDVHLPHCPFLSLVIRLSSNISYLRRRHSDAKRDFVDENHPLRPTIDEQARKADAVRDLAGDLRRRVDQFTTSRAFESPTRMFPNAPLLPSTPRTALQQRQQPQQVQLQAYEYQQHHQPQQPSHHAASAADDVQNAQIQLLTSLQKAETQIAELRGENNALRSRWDEKQQECKRLESELDQTRNAAMEVRKSVHSRPVPVVIQYMRCHCLAGNVASFAPHTATIGFFVLSFRALLLRCS